MKLPLEAVKILDLSHAMADGVVPDPLETAYR
jgi:hypothetical protein